MEIRTVAEAVVESVLVEGTTTLRDASTLVLDAGTEAAVVLAEEAPAGVVTYEDVARALAEGHDAARTIVLAIADREPVLARG